MSETSSAAASSGAVAAAAGASGGSSRKESGLIGGIFSRAQHDSIRVKFSDVDWATIVRAGGVSQSEVSELSPTTHRTSSTAVLGMIL